MAKHIPKAFRRATALLTSLLLIAAQMVLPLAALAQDISMLPTVTIQWSAADGSVQSMPVTATLYGDQVVYWASVSEEAMQAGVSIQSITGPEDPQLVTYGPAAGTLLTGNATAVDGSVAASIEVYRGGVFEIAYPFYLSTVAIPPYQPAGPTSGTVYISYRYEGGEEFYGYEDVVPVEGRSFAPDLSLVPAGYELVSTGEVLVTLNPDGTTSPNPVVFEVQQSAPQVVNSTVTFHHLDEVTGQQITGDTWQELAPETYSAATYQQAVEGYTYSYATPDPFTVDGTGTPVEVTLYYTPSAPEPVNSVVTIHHLDKDTNQQITGDTTEEAAAGMETYSSIYQMQVEGYTYSSANPESFTPDGTGTPVEVTLYYAQNAPEPVNSTVTFHHRDAGDGSSTLADDTTQSLPAGPYDSAAYAVAIDGYTFQSADPVSFNVDGAGTPVEVTLYYAQNAPEPVNSMVTFHHKDAATDQELTSTQQELAPNTYPSPDYKTEIEGYTYASAAQETFVVDGSGAAVDVTLYYNANAPTEPVVLEEYTNQYGITTKGSLNLRSSPTTEDKNNKVVQGVNKDVIMPATQRVQGLDNDGYSWYRVNYNGTDCYVRDDCFRLLTEEEMQQYLNVEVPVKYVDQATGEAFYTATAQCMKGGSVTVEVDLSQAQGYTLVSEASVQVSADANGTLTPAEAVFTFAKEQQAVKGTVSVIYVDEAQKPVAEPQTFERDPGSYSVNEFAINTPEGYEPLQVNVQEVIVHDDGTVEPETVVFTYAVKQTEPVNSVVTFHHLCDGAAITGDTQQTLAPNTYGSASYQATVEGYTYAGASPETFTVDGSGAPIEVTLTYTKNAPQVVNSIVTFHHVDANGAPIAADTQQELAPNTYGASGYQVAVPGYTYTSANPESFTVDGQGTPVEVTLTYTKDLVASKVTFHHVDADGKPLMADRTVEIAPSAESYRSESYAAAAPDGYLYASANPETFTVDGSGTPITVVFTYAQKPAVTAPVTFEYVSESGRVVDNPMTVDLPVGPNDVMEYCKVVEGYTFKSVSSQTVEVSADGVATPAKVTFTYTENPTTATVQVHYRNSIGDDLPGSPVIKQLGPGTYTIQPEDVPAGYIVSSSAQPQTVTVTNDLVATPNSISFTCYDANITGTLTINYYDAADLSKPIATEQRPLKPGLQTVAADDSVVAKVGNYQRTEGYADQQVQVNEDGTVVPATISFYYKSVQNTSYVGYAVTTRQTAMRSSAAANGAVTQTLTVNTLLYINGQQQVSGVTWDSSQTVLGGTSASGWVTDADVRHISASEAQALIDQYNQQQQKPTQSPGYYITLYNSVPLRTYTNIYAEARYLKKDTVVYVHSQEYDGSRNIWHLTTYDGVTGYVLNGQLRKLTDEEVKNYLANGNPSTPENPGGNPYNPNGASSYGYITANSVNFRTAPNGSRIKQLNKYAMAMILGTRQVDGVTWYNVNYNGQIGWIHGDYFHQMTLTEFNSFLSSSQYQQGLTNNAVATATPKPSTGGSTSGNTSGNKGSATQGSVSSVEDWNVGTWQNTGANTQNTYAPFNPYA
ncbi:MAG TPA: MucBP domain-containing protein, partial [Candidatus Limiplasma pullistercoris]|nr:MucBP domain-containing protein [Candidatus Limiplasma pullistercoris]